MVLVIVIYYIDLGGINILQCIVIDHMSPWFHSSIHSFIHCFIHLSVPIHSFHSSILMLLSIIHLSYIYPFIFPLIHSFHHQFIPSIFMLLFVHSSIHSIYSFHQSRVFDKFWSMGQISSTMISVCAIGNTSWAQLTKS